MGKVGIGCRRGVLKLILCVLMLFGLTGNAYATNYTWTNSLFGLLVGGNWNTASNWSPSGIPGAGDNVTITDAVLGYTITLTSNVTVASIQVNGVLSLLGPIAIATGTNSLTVTNSLTIGGTASVLTPTVLSLTGTSTVTLNSAISIYSGGELDLGSTGNYVISGAIVNFLDFTTNSVLLALLNNSGGPILNNAGILTTTGSSIFNLNGSFSQIKNTGTFNLGTASIIYPTATSSSVANTSPGVFTLRSDATGSAAIAAVNGAVTGIYNVERFLTGAGTMPFLNRGYRLLSSPVNQTADATTAASTFGLNYLNQSYTVAGTTYYGAYITGPGAIPGNGFNATNGVPTIYFYNESLVFSNASFTGGNHVGVNSINTTTIGGVTPVSETLSDGTTKKIPIGNGFIMYFVGSTGPVGTFLARPNAFTTSIPTDATITASGHINQGTFTVQLWTSPTPATPAGKLSYTSGSPVNTHTHPFPGVNMVGNPYPSTIDLNVVLSDNPGQISAIYVLSEKDSPNQKYIAYTPYGGSTPPPLNYNYAVSGEGFLVQASGLSKSLTFKEDQKLPIGQLPGSALVLALHKTSSQADLQPQSNALAGLYMKLEKDSTTYNYCGIFFRSDWSDKYADFDAKDMNATSNDIVMSSLSSDSIRLAVNHMPDYTKGIKVKLYANASANGTYNLKMEGVTNIDTLYDIYLIDNYKKDSLDIRRYGSYAFDILKSDTSSFGGSRFGLSIHPRPLPAYKLLSFTGQKVTSGVQLNWKTEAEGNYTGFVLQKADGATFNSLYTKQSDSSGTYTYIDPNPVTGNNTYRLQQSDIVGNLSYSSPVTVVYDQSVTTTANTVSIYPNPAMDIINLTINQNSAITNTQQNQTIGSSNQTTGNVSYSIKIISTTGAVIKSATSAQPNWQDNVSALVPGTYIIQVVNNKNKSLVGRSTFVKM